jgi:hypothetical protein
LSQGEEPQGESGYVLPPSDPDTVRFINEIAGYVPAEFRDLAWGYLNKLVGMSKFEPTGARAAKKWAQAFSIEMKSAVPTRKVTARFITDIDNFLFFFRMNVDRATVPGREREMIVKSTRETHTFTGSSAGGGGGRKRRWPF